MNECHPVPFSRAGTPPATTSGDFVDLWLRPGELRPAGFLQSGTNRFFYYSVYLFGSHKAVSGLSPASELKSHF